MKIAIDLDGTAWKHREFFREFVLAMKTRGHEIGILTAHYYETYLDPDLKLWKLRGFPKPDFYIARKGEDEHRMLIGDWKRKSVLEFEIDVLFDDFGGNNPDIEQSFLRTGIDNLLVFKVIPGESK